MDLKRIKEKQTVIKFFVNCGSSITGTFEHLQCGFGDFFIHVWIKQWYFSGKGFSRVGEHRHMMRGWNG